MELTAQAIPQTAQEQPAKPKGVKAPVYGNEIRRAVREAYVTGKVPSLSAAARLFNIPQDTARIWYYRGSWKEVRDRFEANELEKLAPAIPPKPEMQPHVVTTQSDKLAIIEKQLTQLDDLLENCGKPSEFNALTQAKERLLNAWSLLTGFPRPGVRKAPREGRRGSTAPVMPLEEPAQPGQPEQPK